MTRILFAQACNNAWANHRLLGVCARLTPEELRAPRTSFFPSILGTLNHQVTVDWFYVDALERALAGQPPNPEPRRFFEPQQPFDAIGPLSAAQRAVDRRLVELCRALPAEPPPVPILRRTGVVVVDAAERILAHLLQHQIHHRGQVHAMLSGTSQAPPQLDEFFCADEAPLRAAELAELGLTESEIFA